MDENTEPHSWMFSYFFFFVGKSWRENEKSQIHKTCLLLCSALLCCAVVTTTQISTKYIYQLIYEWWSSRVTGLEKQSARRPVSTIHHTCDSENTSSLRLVTKKHLSAVRCSIRFTGGRPQGKTIPESLRRMCAVDAELIEMCVCCSVQKCDRHDRQRCSTIIDY